MNRAAGPRLVVRRVDLSAGAAAVAAAAACLAPAELARADRGTGAVRARRILVRAALRELLGELLGVPARAVPLVARPGRPVAWVQKEAVVKGRGTGLRADLAAVAGLPGDDGRIGRWQLYALAVPAGHVACAAVRWTGLPARVRRPRPVLA